MKKQIISVIAWLPFVIAVADSPGVFPAQYQEYGVCAIVALAILYCVLLAKSGEPMIMDLANVPAGLCVLSGIASVYAWLNGEPYTISSMLEAFCCFICGVWLFAYKTKEKKSI